MSHSTNIWIIDENTKRAAQLAASLCFIGESAEVVTVDDVKHSALHHVETVFLGAMLSGDHEAIIKSQPETPFILIGETLKSLLPLANVAHAGALRYNALTDKGCTGA